MMAFHNPIRILGFYNRQINRGNGIIVARKQTNKVGIMMTKPRIYTMSFASVYPLYIQKAERKERTKEEVDQIVFWLTGYDEAGLADQIERNTDFETFFTEAPMLNPNVGLIKGVVCGVRVEEIEEPLMQKIRYLDKLIDELSKGKKMEKILRMEK